MFEHYRVAVALNNMGVALLERGAYCQAMKTLKDSILVMKGILRTSSKCTVGDDIQTKIDMATKRLMSPQPVPSTLPVTILSHDGSLLYSSMKSVLTQGDFCAVLVRIEPLDLRSPEHQDTDLESAIILYNFAIAHICMAKHSDSTTDVKQFREGSLKLLEMACDIAAEEVPCKDRMEEEENDDDSEDKFGELRLLLSAAALKNLIEVLADMGRIAEATEYHQRFIILGNSLDEMEAMFVWVGDSASAPAA